MTDETTINVTDTDAPAELPSTLTVTFKEPLKNKANAEVTQINLREPTVGELSEFFAANATAMEQMMALIAKVGSNPLYVVRQMLVSDYNQCRDYLMGFINAGAQEI